MAKTLAIVLAALIVILVLTGLTNDQPDKRYEIITYTVQSGDTLDGIYYGCDVNMPLLKWRYDVKKMNGKKDSGLMPGEELKIYVESK